MFFSKVAVVAVAAGLMATGGAATALAAPPTATVTPMLAAFSGPLDHDKGNDHDRGNRDRDDDHGRHDNDHGRGWDGDRRRDGDWDGHPWRWWHDWGISADLCRDGGGHVDWNRHRCEGGRFDDFRVR